MAIQRGWRNPAKENRPTTDGKCPYCKKHVANLESHIRGKHKGAKALKR